MVMNKLSMKTKEEVIEYIIGPINPVGSTHIDRARIENLKDLLEILEKLVFQVDQIVIHNKNRPEMSMRDAGKIADDFLRDIRDQLNDDYEERKGQ